MAQEIATNIDLLRHGACAGGEIYRGRTDAPLSSEGWTQMAGALADSSHFHRVVTSPLSRCRAFAEHWSEQAGVPLRVHPGLQEMDFGEWEGRLLRDVWRENPELVTAFYADPAAVTPPGAEPAADAQRRIVLAWRELMSQCAGENLLLVCHGGVIRLLLSHLLHMPLSKIASLHIPYAAVARLRVYHREQGDFPVLLSLNAAEAPL